MRILLIVLLTLLLLTSCSFSLAQNYPTVSTSSVGWIQCDNELLSYKQQGQTRQYRVRGPCTIGVEIFRFFWEDYEELSSFSLSQTPIQPVYKNPAIKEVSIVSDTTLAVIINQDERWEILDDYVEDTIGNYISLKRFGLVDSKKEADKFSDYMKLYSR